MIALISFLLVVWMSLFVVKLGSLALQETGLSKDVADFQAQSAFSGVGFTTSESESIVNNPVRRKILRILILLGSAGITTAIATLVLTFTADSASLTLFSYTFNDNLITDLALIALAMTAFWLISNSSLFETAIKWLFKIPLQQLKKKVYLFDYEQILEFSKGYSIATFEVPSRHWMCGKTIGQLRMKKEGVVILGVSRDVGEETTFIGSPSLSFSIKSKDKITLYGQENTLKDIAKRPTGSKGKEKQKESLHKAKILKEVKKLDEKRVEELSEIEN